MGTAFLVAAVVGSGIAAQRLSPHDVGLELLENTVATAAALVAIIFAVGPVSGAHLNPVVTLVDRAFGGLRTRAVGALHRRPSSRGAPPARSSPTPCSASPPWRSRSTTGPPDHISSAEAVATFGLVLVIFGVVRAGRGSVVPFAVGAYIAAAYWFTSSTSFANPAVTFARMLSNSFAGIAPTSVPGFVGLELVGGASGPACIAVLYPRVRDDAGDVLLHHEEAA